MLKEDVPAYEHCQAEGGTVHEPVQVGRLLAGYARAKAVQNRSNWVEQQPLAFGAQHSDVIKDGREKDSERQQDFDNVLYVPEEKACSGHNHSSSNGQHHHHQ
jgi:hypothetical protein